MPRKNDAANGDWMGANIDAERMMPAEPHFIYLSKEKMRQEASNWRCMFSETDDWDENERRKYHWEREAFYFARRAFHAAPVCFKKLYAYARWRQPTNGQRDFWWRRLPLSQMKSRSTLFIIHCFSIRRKRRSARRYDIMPAVIIINHLIDIVAFKLCFTCLVLLMTAAAEDYLYFHQLARRLYTLIYSSSLSPT